VADRVERYGPGARARLQPFFQNARVPYPPARFALAAFKQEGELHLFAAGRSQSLTFVRQYHVLAASGKLGPKLEAGDKQVPEGVYEIDSLNPNSRYHLSLRLNYPNATDRRRAREDGRSDLGGDIMIHGDSVSIGCLAMGDAVAEELFVLAADAGLEQARVIISPVDFRRSRLPSEFRQPAPWVKDLYGALRKELSVLPMPRT
jgi:murein L,D-transpeptidase YafK